MSWWWLGLAVGAAGAGALALAARSLQGELRALHRATTRVRRARAELSQPLR